MFQKIEKEFYKQSEKNLIERVQQMKETKKNHKINLKITGILESFKEKFQPTNYDAIRKSLKIEMIHRQHNFAEQVV